MTSPVEELREAAKRLRDLAASCEQGQWSLDADDRGHAWINLPAYSHAWGMHGFPDEARYVASMHPGVAFAVADWLEDEAIRIDDVPYRVDSDWIERDYRAPLAVARAYLGQGGEQR